MVEKHHPASSKPARTRVERSQRREGKLCLTEKGKDQYEDRKEGQKRFKERKGYFRGAKVTGM